LPLPPARTLSSSGLTVSARRVSSESGRTRDFPGRGPACTAAFGREAEAGSGRLPALGTWPMASTFRYGPRTSDFSPFRAAAQVTLGLPASQWRTIRVSSADGYGPNRAAFDTVTCEPTARRQGSPNAPTARDFPGRGPACTAAFGREAAAAGRGRVGSAACSRDLAHGLYLSVWAPYVRLLALQGSGSSHVGPARLSVANYPSLECRRLRAKSCGARYDYVRTHGPPAGVPRSSDGYRAGRSP